MSSDQLPPEPSAVALVVDSSLAVGNEWPRVFGEYISVLLKRLGEPVPNPSARVRLAYVSYATADTVPSPILCKRFFTEPNLLFRDMNDNMPKYGIGQTSSGGSRGMAALEGLVAAVELFDTLQPPSRDPQSSINCHILHIAAASPDTTHHPFWNQSPALDEVTWDLLPAELKKRNIHFSTINLLPSLKRYSELYKAVVSNGTPPWFPVRPPHSFLLDSFTLPQHPQPQQIKGTAAKRSNPSQADRPSELKKARPSTITDSPKIPPTPSNPVVSQTLHPAIAPPQPSRPPQNAVPNPQIPPNPALRQQQAAQIAERIRNAEEQLKQIQQNIAAAEAAGNLQQAETLRQEYAKKQELNLNFKKALAQYIQNQNQQLLARQHAQAHLAASQNQQALQKEAMAPSVGQGPNPNAVPSPVSLLGAMHDLTQVPNHQQHVRSASSSAFQPNSPGQITASTSNPPNPGAAPNNINLQILEQQRVRASQMSGSQSQGGVPTQNIMQHGNQGFNPSPGVSQAPQGEQQKPPPNNSTAVWAGSLNWSGMGSTGKKEVSTQVIASSTNVASCHVTTWPRSLTLVPTRESLVPNPDLLIWIRRHNPAVCTLAPNPRVPDPKTNEFNFFTLVQLLTTKKIYATAGWTTPSGSQDNNVLLFPVAGRGLAGAFFPLTGVPEMPKAGAMPFNLSPEATARFQALTPEQKNVFLAQMARQRQQQQMAQQQQQQQQQQQADSNGNMPFNASGQGSNQNNNMNAALSMMGPQVGLGITMGGQPSFPGVVPRPAATMNAPGVQGNLSYEMLQSFMQRNADMNQQS